MRTFIAYRGLHHVTLAGFDPRYSTKRGEPTYVVASLRDFGAEGTWAHHFLTSYHAITQPKQGELYHGLILRLEVPGHLISQLDYEHEPLIAHVERGGNLVDAIKPERMSDMTPYISHVGVANADKKVTMYPYAKIFDPDGQPTSFARTLDAQMTK
jgi:hypothetical protein